MSDLKIVETAHLYAPLHAELMDLLSGLSDEQWSAPTVCAGWSVKDIAAHMLDTQLRILSMGRDGFQPPAPGVAIASYADLVGFLNSLNASWVLAMRRVSPQVLMELLRNSGPELASYVEGLDMQETALFPVAWAGEAESKVWFDVGRNYTEYWHHQQQIRDAVGAVGLTSRKWLGPVLELFMRAVPRVYEGVDRGRVVIEIEGDAGGVWGFVAGEGLRAGPLEVWDARVVVDQDTAWRLFTKGLGKEEVRERMRLEGDGQLAERFLNGLAVMA